MNQGKFHNYQYDDHSSIPFKLVHLSASKVAEVEKAHRHNFFQLFFFTQDSGKHLIDFDEGACSKNSIHIVNPGSIHLLASNENLSGNALLFSREFFDNGQSNNQYFLYRNDFNKFLYLEKTDFDELMLLIDKIKQEIELKSEFKDQAIKHLLELIIIFIQRKIVFNTNEDFQESDLQLKHFTQLINRFYNEEHQLSFYAKELKLSQEKLNLLCRTKLNKKASSLLQERILLEAKRLLFYSPISIKEIAFNLGYEDPSYFNRFFKNKIGLTPKEFRTQVRLKYH